jgi:ubiquitin carboxyl-terminal hydrolase 25/28
MLLIAKRPKKEFEGPKLRPVYSPLSAIKDIERSFGYSNYVKRSRVIDTTRDEHPHYASLGATDDLVDTDISWAYDRQCKCDPVNKPYYLDCLAGIAKGRGNGAEDLQTKVATALSSGEVGLDTIEDAYKFFGLGYNTKEGDDHIMGLYKSRIESAPRQKDEARECLHVIANHRKSEKIEALANDKALTFEEALEFLQITSSTDSDSIEAAAIALVS